MECLAHSRIQANMRRFAADGINHLDPEHVAAYLLARQQTPRPRAEHILAILRSAKSTSEAGFVLSDDFYLVPKGNLTEEEVRKLGNFYITEDRLRATMDVPRDTNLSAVWIIDASCPRETLGPGIKRMTVRELWGFRAPSIRDGGGSVKRVVRRTWRFSTHCPIYRRHASTLVDSSRRVWSSAN